MRLELYQSSFRQTWDTFIKNAKNAHFLFYRDYMEYHSDRFTDHSLLFFKGDDLIAVLPANIRESVMYSHGGLTFGGLLFSRDTRIKDVLECFEEIKRYAIAKGINKLVYKKIPPVYCTYPSEEDVYALFLSNAVLYRRDAAFVIRKFNAIRWSDLRKRGLKKASAYHLSCHESGDYNTFYEILSEVLSSVHNVKPVHSLEEMIYLSGKFPENIKLIASYKDGVMLSGAWLFINGNVVHTQYIATSAEGRQMGGFEMVIDYIQTHMDYEYLSFGTSTEKDGRYLNEGLAMQKELFGARTITHDFYELEFNRIGYT